MGIFQTLSLSVANDGLGDPLRDGGAKINSNWLLAEQLFNTTSTNISAPTASQRGLFHVSQGVNQTSLGLPGFHQITFDIQNINPNSWFNIASSRFTPLKAGWYNMTFSVQLAYTTFAVEGCIAAIYQNGVLNRQSGPMLVTASTALTLAAAQLTDLFYFNGTTDYAEYFAYVGAGALDAHTIAASGARVFAAGHFVASTG